MSSAAMQLSPAQPTSTHYVHQQNPYFPQQNLAPLAASPASSARKASARSNGASSSAQQPPKAGRFEALNESRTSSTARAPAAAASLHASPSAPNTAFSTQASTAMPQPSTRGGPVNPPPRTSSHQKATSPTSGMEPQQYTDILTYRPASSGQPQQVVRNAPPATYDARPRQSPRQSRSVNAVGMPPLGTDLPREGSTVINRIVVDDPQEDLARERARQAEAQPMPAGTDLTPITGLGLVGSEGVDDGARAGLRSRQDHSATHRKETKFGDYILGQTLGEGEFGKVKMGWKKDGGVQVAIKLIRRETLGSNPSRLPKIYREISILRGLQHPNIVRLHEMVETERHIGIILEYASGGELFDYILNHRYLKDPAARRLFAQLVSGVGYLHTQGIVHRDLKLENLLLDRNRNIIITDFGFANTFNPEDEIGEDIENKLHQKDFVRKMGLEQLNDRGQRRGDLMQTSCGSPCYAAPELVVSDSLYTGRKVDVWSCGVILYAMLAGYLPFDDDPANPEGDNINQLYKYIVSTPLTFPEFVTPHARDLLRRILVPDPRRRADLFEVARHSWLGEYSHVVSFITSTPTNDGAASTTTIPAAGAQVPARTSSRDQGTLSPPAVVTRRSPQNQALTKEEWEAKRRTVQVEYVPPASKPARGETAPDLLQRSGAETATAGKSRVRPEQGPIEVKSEPVTAPVEQYATTVQSQMPQRVPVPQQPGLPSRSNRDVPRSVSDTGAFNPERTGYRTAGQTARPGTGSRIPSRGNSHGLPAAATATTANAQGHFSKPVKASRNGKQYVISAPISQHDTEYVKGHIDQGPDDESQQEQHTQPLITEPEQRGHKRSTTESGMGRFFTRPTSVFGARGFQEQRQRKQDRQYPPTAMSNTMPRESSGAEPRKSTSSSRRPSFERFVQTFSRNAKTDGADKPGDRSSKRWSAIFTGSLTKTFSRQDAGSRPVTRQDSDTQPTAPAIDQRRNTRPASRQMAFGRGQSPDGSKGTGDGSNPFIVEARTQKRFSAVNPPRPASNRDSYTGGAAAAVSSIPTQRNYTPAAGPRPLTPGYAATTQAYPTPSQRLSGHYPQPQQQQQQAQRPMSPANTNHAQTTGHASYDDAANRQRPASSADQYDSKAQRRFTEGYEGGRPSSRAGAYAGGGGAVRKVMDYFRRRGKARGE